MSERYDAVIDELQGIVGECSTRGDRAGYFAAMYLAVTRTVRRRSEAGLFDDPARMERFVATFAARYLDAYAAWRVGAAGGSIVPSSWQLAFDSSRRWRPIALQHLLLGINAHVNLDLGVTAAGLAGAGAGPGALDAVRADFDAVNDVLGELVDGCQGALGEVSPWLGVVDRVGGRHDEELIHFSLIEARRQAWSVAVRLAPMPATERAAAATAVDDATAALARRVAHPGVLASALLLVVRLRERAAPATVMALLAAVEPPTG